ncbi:MAG: tRNA lysidine(34) synthetase TilS [Clostridia bacterium]|nr:tRNA lysidine(34) synthetase TilS [Clostridia bacterium]
MSRTDFSHTDFLNRVRVLIQRENMISSGDSVLIGLSGGADSVALFRVLLELREEYDFKITCAHINHGLRGETADRDRKFVENLCGQFDVGITVSEENVADFAKQHGLSIEDAGRQIRYAFFKKQGTDKIAVAHTKNDNAETVLMNLIKGNIPLGIVPRRENIIRPLLGVTKEEIYAYLQYLEQDFVTDETNFTIDYTRNKVRLELIPHLEEDFNTNFTNTVYHSADVLYREYRFLEKLTDEIYHREMQAEKDGILLSCKGLFQVDEVLIKRVIRRAYYEICPEGQSVSYEQVERVFCLCIENKKGKQISLPGGVVALLSGDFLIFRKKKQSRLVPVVLELEQPVCYGDADDTVCLSKSKREDAYYCYPIRVKTGETVTVRTRCDGDKLYFHNLNIHKKLSDFFIDKKIPLHEREQTRLVCVEDCVRVVVGHFYEEVSDCPREEQYYIIIESI